MKTMKPARFHYRLGANQPAASPTAHRLAEMAEAIWRETDGAFRLEVHPKAGWPRPADVRRFAKGRARILSVGRSSWAGSRH